MKLTCLGCQGEFTLDEGSDLAEAQCPVCHLPAANLIAFAKTQIVAKTTPSPTSPTLVDGQDRKQPKIPDRIGKYEILGKAGAGGMGVVYKARHTELSRIVALKVMIAGEHAAEDTIERFQREARAAAGLSHPNIVSVYDVGKIEPMYYIVMEYVDGTPLDDLIQDTGVQPRDAARMIRDLARALHYAHQQNIIHRDIKPGNILVDRHGTAKLVDFGLAKSTLDDKTLTKTGEIIGTACYMPPEQASGSMKNVDTQSDIYSLGAVLYEMLTRRAPFAGDTLMAVIKQVEEKDPVAPSRLTQHIPRDLETICMKAMAKEKKRRYMTAEEMAKDLDAFLDGAPIQARPSSVFYRATKWSRRHPAIFTAFTISIVAASIIGALAYRNYQLRRRAPEPGPTVDDSSLRLAKATPRYEEARSEIYDKAMKYRAEARVERRRVLEKAVGLLEEAIRIYPDYADAFFLRGVARQALAQTSLASQDFDRAIALNPRHADAYYARVHLRMRSLRDRKTRSFFESEESREMLRLEQEVVQKDIETLKTLGTKKEKALVAEARFCQIFGDRKRALELADEALKENPAFADAFVVRASIKKDVAIYGISMNARLLKEALNDCTSAIASEVNNAEAYRVRAEIHMSFKDYDAATADLKEMESIAPDEAQTYVDKALVLDQDPVRTRSVDELRIALDRAIDIDPNNTTARYRRAILILESPPLGEDPKEKYGRARDDLDAALRSDPSFSPARIFRIVCSTALGDQEGADRDLDLVIDSLPGMKPNEQERMRKNIKALTRVLLKTYEISRTEATLNEGDHALQRRKFPEAEQKYLEVLRRVADPKIVNAERITPDESRSFRIKALYNLACVYSLMGDADRGIEQLKLAIEAGYSNFEHILQDEDLVAVRAHPGFKDLIKRP